MKLQYFMLSITLYVVLHIPLINKSIQFNLYRIHIMPLSHPVLKKSPHYSIQEEYLAIRPDSQYILFPLSADIVACQISNGQFCPINSSLYSIDTSKSCSYTLFLNEKAGISCVWILSVINQTHDEAINIDENFWALSTLQDDIKMYITCLQFSYPIKLHFPYGIIYLPDGYEANAISFWPPSNNKLHMKTPMESQHHKLGFNTSYSKLITST